LPWVEDSTPDLMWQITVKIQKCVTGYGGTIPINSILGRLRQEDHMFQASLGYIVKPCLGKKEGKEPQGISLCIYKFSKIGKTCKSCNILVLSILGNRYSTRTHFIKLKFVFKAIIKGIQNNWVEVMRMLPTRNFFFCHNFRGYLLQGNTHVECSTKCLAIVSFKILRNFALILWRGLLLVCMKGSLSCLQYVQLIIFKWDL
jgi:hypothetical protein